MLDHKAKIVQAALLQSYGNGKGLLFLVDHNVHRTQKNIVVIQMELQLLICFSQIMTQSQLCGKGLARHDVLIGGHNRKNLNFVMYFIGIIHGIHLDAVSGNRLDHRYRGAIGFHTVGDHNDLSRFGLFEQSAGIFESRRQIRGRRIGIGRRQILLINSLRIDRQLCRIDLVKSEFDNADLKLILANIQHRLNKFILFCLRFRITFRYVHQEDQFVILIGDLIGKYQPRQQIDRQYHGDNMQRHGNDTVSRATVFLR